MAARISDRKGKQRTCQSPSRRGPRGCCSPRTPATAPPAPGLCASMKSGRVAKQVNDMQDPIRSRSFKHEGERAPMPSWPKSAAIFRMASCICHEVEIKKDWTKFHSTPLIHSHTPNYSSHRPPPWRASAPWCSARRAGRCPPPAPPPGRAPPRSSSTCKQMTCVESGSGSGGPLFDAASHAAVD